MANTIKGLTVEIGGDTTKLGKALDDVNRRSKSLSSELGQINRMLKLDPGNTDLLAQKQQVLSDAIETTSKKLDTLREAERQVQAQFERGEVSEEQYRALQREIIATEGKLKSYQRAARETAEATERIGDGADDAADELEDTGKEADKAADKVDEFADAADDAGEAGEGMGSKLAKAAKAGFTAITAVVGAAVTGLVAAAESTREYRTEMGKLETAFTQQGFSAEAAQGAYTELVGVLGETDQAVEAANHLAQLTDNEEDLAKWSGDILPGVFATFGDSLPIEGLTEAANETAKVGAVTGPLADALNWAGVSEDAFNASLAACTTEQERQALITETLSELYGDAAAAYKETNAEVIRANQANEAWTHSLAGIGAAIDPVITDVKMMGATLLDELVPGVEQVAESFRGVLNGDEGAAAELGAAFSGIITQLLDKVTELAPTLVQVATSLLTTLVTTIISQLPQLLTTGVQLVTTILEGLTSAIPQLTAAIVNMIPLLTDALVTGIPQLILGAVQLFNALLLAIPQILPPLVAALPQIVLSIVNGLAAAIPELIQGALAFFLAIVDALPLMLQQLLPQLPTIIQTVVSALTENIPVLLDAAVQLFMAIVQAIPLIVVELVKSFPQILSAVVTGIGGIWTTVITWTQNLGAKLDEWLGTLPDTFGTWLAKVVGKVVAWAAEMAAKALTAANNFLSNVVNTLKNIPAKVASAISGAVQRVASWGSDMVSRARTAANNFLNNVVNTLKNIPAKVASSIAGAVQRVASWGSNMLSKARSAMSSVVSGVTSTLGQLPSKVLSIGTNLVTGLWNGINNKLTWLKNKIKNFASSAINAIKDFFGVHSPSTETAWVGDMLDQGLAKGLEDNARVPIKAMQDVAGGVLDAAAGDVDGMALTRELQARSTAAAAATNPLAAAGLLERLDKILSAIEAGQVINLDGKALVGATYDLYDNILGQRRALAARGALT